MNRSKDFLYIMTKLVFIYRMMKVEHNVYNYLVRKGDLEKYVITYENIDDLTKKYKESYKRYITLEVPDFNNVDFKYCSEAYDILISLNLLEEFIIKEICTDIIEEDKEHFINELKGITQDNKKIREYILLGRELKEDKNYV